MVHSSAQHLGLDVKDANFPMVAICHAAVVEMHGSYYSKEISPFSTRRICSRNAKRNQEFSNVIGWQSSKLFHQL